MKSSRTLRVHALACALLLSEITFASDRSTDSDGPSSDSSSFGPRVKTRSQTSLSGSAQQLPVPAPLLLPVPIEPAPPAERLWLTDAQPMVVTDIEHYSDMTVSEAAFVKSVEGEQHQVRNFYLNPGNQKSPFVAPLFPINPALLPTFQQESDDIRKVVQDSRLLHYAGKDPRVLAYQFSLMKPKGTVTTFEPICILGLVRRTEMREAGIDIMSPARKTVTVISGTPKRLKEEERKRRAINREKREHAAALKEAKQIARGLEARKNPAKSPVRPVAPKKSYKLEEVFKRYDLTITKACQLLGLNEDDVFAGVPIAHRGKAHHALTDTIMAQALVEILRQKERKRQQDEFDAEGSDENDDAPDARVPSTPSKFPMSPPIFDDNEDEDDDDGRKPAGKRRMSSPPPKRLNFDAPVIALAPVAGEVARVEKKARTGPSPTD